MVTGDNQATVTFELTSSIKPFISTLNLIYGQFLDSNALTFTTPIPPESIPDDGSPGNVTATQLAQVNSINYQFKLRTTIGLYMYESNVVYLYPIAETTTTADRATTDAVNDNNITTITETTTATHRPTTPDATDRPTTVRPATPGTTDRPTTVRPTTPGTTDRPTTVRPTTPDATVRPTTPGAVNTTTVTEAMSTDNANLTAPTIIQVVATASGSIMVTWSKLDGASGYVVRYFDETGDLDELKNVSIHGHTSVCFTSLICPGVPLISVYNYEGESAQIFLWGLCEGFDVTTDSNNTFPIYM